MDIKYVKYKINTKMNPLVRDFVKLTSPHEAPLNIPTSNLLNHSENSIYRGISDPTL